MIKAAVYFIFLFGICIQMPLASDRYSKDRFLRDEDAPWEITADRLTQDEDKAIYIAEGNVVIKKADQILRAEKAVYNYETSIVHLSGGFRFESAGDVLSGDKGTFDLKNQTGEVEKGRLFLAENHFYISGSVMEKLSEDTYRVEDCEVTTCDADRPAWSITGSEVKVTIEGYGKVKHAAFRTKGIPLAYVPYMIFPAKTKRQTGFLPPSAGYSSRNGADVEVPFFWAISDQTDATFYQRYMTQRGYMQGLEFRYLASENSYGIFLFDILSDRKEIKDMNDPDEVELSPFDRTNQTRYWFRGKADQDLPLGFDARLDADFVSDQDYLREFENKLSGFNVRPDFVEETGRPYEEIQSPTRRSAFRLSHDGESYSMQFLGSYHQRPENPALDDTAQPLGGADFTLLPTQVMRAPIFLSLDTDYDYVWRDMGEKGHRTSVMPEVRFPLWFGPIEFEPSFSYEHTSQWLDELDANDKRQTKRAYDGKIRMATHIERVFETNFERAKRLKHRIRPSITYEYRSPQDDGEFQPWFEAIDQDGKINEVTVSLENFLDARLEDKKGNVRYRQWATFDLSQSYDIDEERRTENPSIPRRPLGPLSADLTITPFRQLDLRGSADWDHYESRISTAEISLDLNIDRAGGKQDTFTVDYQYENSGDKSLDLFADVNLFYGFSIGTSLERSLNEDRNISNSYWLGYERQCWGLRFEVERAEGDTSFMVVFQLFGLGDISL